MIDEADISRLKEIFVTRQECDDKNDALQESVHSVDKRLSIIESQQDKQYQKSSATFAAVIGNIVTIVVACIILAIKMGAI